MRWVHLTFALDIRTCTGLFGRIYIFVFVMDLNYILFIVGCMMYTLLTDR